DMRSSDMREHFLSAIILAFLDTDGEHRLRDGHVATDRILTEMQSLGFTIAGVEAALRGLNNKKLIETPKRTTFAEDQGRLFGEMPDSFRISTIGAYHLKRWIAEFAYLDLMSLDTPIFDPDVREKLLLSSGLTLKERFQRADTFRTYLTNTW